MIPTYLIAAGPFIGPVAIWCFACLAVAALYFLARGFAERSLWRVFLGVVLTVDVGIIVAGLMW